MEIKKDYILKIYQDKDIESPREWDDLGYFITQQRNYNSPDKNKPLQAIIKEAYDEQPTNATGHIKKIKRLCKQQFNEDIVLIVPISKYEHGNIRYYIGDHKVCSFDSGVCGFYIITKESLKKCYGLKRPINKTLLEKIQVELDLYNTWENGEIYCFILHQKQTITIDKKEYSRIEYVDNYCGFYGLEDIKKHLPEQFKNKDLNDYIIY